VRLKDNDHVRDKSVLCLFQFQFGAIKSEIIVDEDFNIVGFQFQFGAIKSNYYRLLALVLSGFQFQFGAIKSLNHYIAHHPAQDISIPIWCD